MRIRDWSSDVCSSDLVDDPAALRFRVNTQTPGEDADLRFWRDGREYSASLPMEMPPEDPPRRTTVLNGRNPLDGATVANLSPAVVAELSLDGGRRGVVILSIAAGSVAARYGSEVGEIGIESCRVQVSQYV